MDLIQSNAAWLGCIELKKLFLGVALLRLRRPFFALLPEAVYPLTSQRHPFSDMLLIYRHPDNVAIEYQSFMMCCADRAFNIT